MNIGNRIANALANVSLEDSEFTPEELVAAETEMEEEVLEVVEAQQEVESDAEVVERLETAASSLEAYGILLSDREKPLTKTEATLVQIGLESIFTGLGVESVEHKASLEQFEGETDAVQATEVTVEGIKDELAKVYATIKAFVESLIAKISKFFTTIFNAAASLKKAAASLRKDAGATKGTAGDAKVSVTKVLAYGGKTDIASIASGLEKSADDVSALIDATKNVTDKYFGAVTAATKEIIAGKDPAVEVGPLVADLKKFNDTQLIGGKKITVSDDGKISMADAGGEGGEIEVPSLADITKLANGAYKVGTVLESKKSAVEAIKKNQQEALKAADAVVKSAGAGKVQEFRNKSKIAGVMNAARKDFSVGMIQASGAVAKGAQAAIKLGRSSLGKYKAAA
jgi:hypothetical protein